MLEPQHDGLIIPGTVEERHHAPGIHSSAEVPGRRKIGRADSAQRRQIQYLAALGRDAWDRARATHHRRSPLASDQPSSAVAIGDVQDASSASVQLQ